MQSSTMTQGCFNSCHDRILHFFLQINLWGHHMMLQTKQQGQQDPFSQKIYLLPNNATM